MKSSQIDLNQSSSATIDPEVVLPKQGLVQIFLQIAWLWLKPDIFWSFALDQKHPPIKSNNLEIFG